MVSWIKHLAYYALKWQLVSPQKGAETIVFLASSSSVNGITGKYFCRKSAVESSTLSHDPELTWSLWKLSLELTGLEETMGNRWKYLRPGL